MGGEAKIAVSSSVFLLIAFLGGMAAGLSLVVRHTDPVAADLCLLVGLIVGGTFLPASIVFFSLWMHRTVALPNEAELESVPENNVLNDIMF